MRWRTGFTSLPEVDFGEGIEVISKSLSSPELVKVDLAIRAEATIGPRDIVVTIDDEQAHLCKGFTVIAGKSPGSLAVDDFYPAELKIGAKAQTLTLSGKNLDQLKDLTFKGCKSATRQSGTKEKIQFLVSIEPKAAPGKTPISFQDAHGNHFAGPYPLKLKH